jgi:hypothetical protein
MVWAEGHDGDDAKMLLAPARPVSGYATKPW